MSNEQTQATDDPSGPGWRDVLPDEILQPGDMFDNRGRWERTGNPGLRAREGRGGTYRRRIEPQPEAEPVQVREGRWRTRRGDIKNIRPCEPLKGAYYVWPWTDGFMTFQDNGRHLAAVSDNDLVEYLGPIEPDKTQELETKTQELPAEYTPPEGWRLVRFGELLLPGDEIVQIDDGRRYPTHRIGDAVGPNQQYIRRIKPQPQPEPQPEPQLTPDDPSGPGWRDVEPDELLQDGDMLKNNTGLWLRTGVPGRLAREGYGGTYRRRIEPQQASDSEPETMDDLRKRLAECEVLLAEAGGSGEQVNAELQQLRADLAEVTRERDQYLDSYQRIFGDLETIRETTKAAAVEAISEWLEPIRLVDNPNLSNETLQHLPQIMRSLTGLAQD